MSDTVSYPTTLPNTLGADRLRLRSTAEGRVAADPARAGWRYLSFRAFSLEAGHQEELDALCEHVVVVIQGADVQLEPSVGPALGVVGRASPFSSLPAAAYLPPGVGGVLRLAGTALPGRSLVAVASAPPSGRNRVAVRPVSIARDDIAVEIRGAGNATRQINHIVAPDFQADRLEVVEVLTPSGNWSSWPPHKHDTDDMPTEAALEETYYYWFSRPESWGMQRLYRGDRSRDCNWEVRRGDVVLVTDGYHPFTAAHGDDAYYLNALAGDRRTMACSFDPDYDWVRETWAGLPRDPRVPFVRPGRA